MLSTSTVEPPELGVYYALGDLAGFARRSAVLAIDLTLVCLVCGAIWARGADTGLPQRAVNVIAFCLAWGYLAALKSGPGGTLDLVWLTTDPNRQTLRDKLSGTYVIRRGALPLGRGPIVYPTYFVATMSFSTPEVRRGADKERV